MSRSFIFVVIFYSFSQFLFAQTKQLISLSAGVSKSAGTSYGFETNYDIFIRESFSFQVGVGYYKWGSVHKDQDLFTQPRTRDIYYNEKVSFSPLNIGFKYYYGDHNLVPFLSIAWALNFTSTYLYKYYATNSIRYLVEARTKIGNRSFLEITYCLGVGCLYKISDNVKGVFNFYPFFGGEHSRGVRINIGAAYMIM